MRQLQHHSFLLLIPLIFIVVSCNTKNKIKEVESKQNNHPMVIDTVLVQQDEKKVEKDESSSLKKYIEDEKESILKILNDSLFIIERFSLNAREEILCKIIDKANTKEYLLSYEYDRDGEDDYELEKYHFLRDNLIEKIKISFVEKNIDSTYSYLVINGNSINQIIPDIKVVNSTFSISSKRILPKLYFEKLSDKKLKLFRNEIFARYGYKFKSDSLSMYFKKFDWYEPKFDNVNNKLSFIEKENINRVLKEEKFRKNH